MREKGNTFILYKDIGDGYRWRLRSPTGETLEASPEGHKEKASCEAEMRAAMADHPGAQVLDATITAGSG